MYVCCCAIRFQGQRCLNAIDNVLAQCEMSRLEDTTEFDLVMMAMTWNIVVAAWCGVAVQTINYENPIALYQCCR